MKSNYFLKNHDTAHHHASKSAMKTPTAAEIRDAERSHKRYLIQEAERAEQRKKLITKQRRRFFELLARAGIALPLLRHSSLLAGVFSSRFALAETHPWANKKVVFVCNSQGADPNAWLPDSANAMRDVSAPYASVAGFTHFRQINVLVEGHASARQAMGDPQTQWHLHKPTMDARLADVLGATTPYSYLYIGAQANISINRGDPKELFTVSSLGIPIDNPRDTFNKFFGSKPPDKNDRTWQQLFDAQRRTIDDMKTKLGGEEAVRLGKHLDSLELIEARLIKESKEPFNIEACKAPGINLNDVETIRAGKTQADIIAGALSCGLTKVVTLQVGDNQGRYTVPDSGYGGEVHSGASHGGNRGAHTNVMRYHHTIPAYLIKKLSETTDADGKPLIESTVVAVVNDMGDGVTHASGQSPWALATKISGFRQGFSKLNRGETRDFHGAIPKGMGIPDNLYVPMGSDTLDLLS